MQNRRCRAPDEKWKWVVAFALFWITFIFGGILRTVGVLLVALVNEFGVSRKDASVPLITCFTVIDMMGILVGPLGQRYGIRSTTIVGSLLASVGFAVNFFATDLRIITIAFGIFGCGFSFSFTLLSVILNRYFTSNRASVNGIVYSGACVGSFTFPPFNEFLIATYGLRGSFLIVSGVILQICVLGCLLRSPQLHGRSQNGSKRQIYSSNDTKVFNEPDTIKPFLKESEKSYKTNQMEETNLDEYSAVENAQKTDTRMLFQKVKIAIDLKHERQVVGNKIKNRNPKMIDMLMPDAKYIKYDEQECSINGLSICQSCPDNSEFKNIRLYIQNPSSDHEHNKRSSSIFNHHPELHEGEIDVLQLRTPLSIVDAFKCVLSCRGFYFFCITMIIFSFTYQLFLVIKVDFFIDKGIAEADIKYMFLSFSFFDILGRNAIGWITDRNYLKRSQFLMLSMAIIAALFFSFPFASTFLTLNMIVSAYGLVYGCTHIIYRVILLDFLPSEVQEVAFGSANFIRGTTTFTYALLIEYFRDKSGSYSNIFFVLAFMCTIASLSWILERYLPKSKEIEMN